MAQGINKVILIGNLGKDPEIRYTQNGTAVCNFTLATTETWGGKDGGEKKEHTEWHNIVAWARLAEVCNEYLHKGKQVYIEGGIRVRKWEDRDGNTRYTTEIVARTMQMLGSKGDGGGGGRPAEDPNNQPGPDVDENLDDDIPF